MRMVRERREGMMAIRNNEAERRNQRKVVRCGALLGLVCGLRLAGVAQTTPSGAVGAASPYVDPGHIPAPVRDFLHVFGDRIQRPGNERMILAGTYTSKGASAGVTITWEVPGRMRVDFSNRNGSPLVFDEVHGPNQGNGFVQDDADVFESLLDDSPEAFFYGMSRQQAHRFLGGRFRADNGKALNYSGPWFNVYQVWESARSQPGSPQREKVYFFDSQTGLLNRVEYFLSPSLKVTTSFSGWKTANGQAYPGHIVRTSGAATVFTIDITGATGSAGANDGVFPGH